MTSRALIICGTRALHDSPRCPMTRFQRYLLTKAIWFALAFLVALALNFYLPRLIPGNPVDALVARMAAGGAEAASLQRIHETYIREFDLDRPAWAQFVTYLGNLAHGDLGTSFSIYP